MNVFENALFLNGFDIKEAKRKLDALHNLSDEEYLDYQKKRLYEIVCFHRENNPIYRDKTKGLEVNSFEDLPIVTKKDFQRPIESIISKGYKKKDLYLGSTSGSSGCTFSFAKDKDSHAFTHAVSLSCMNNFGITPLCKQARFCGIAISGICRYKELLKDFLANRIRFSVFDLSDKQLDAFVQKFKKVNFDYIYGYTSVIVHFAKYLLRQKIVFKEIAPKVRCCIVTSEVCTLEDKFLLEKVLGVKILNEYGASEVGVIAFDDMQGNWRIITDDIYCEVVDNNNKPLAYGQEGRLLITSLSNKAFPFIRYEIGDIGILEKINGKLILKKLLGRICDLVKLPSGRLASGETFYYIVNSILEKQGIVNELIIRQTKIDTFELNVVMKRNLSSNEIGFINSEMAIYLEPGLHLKINRVDRIEHPKSGKVKFFYSMIN